MLNTRVELINWFTEESIPVDEDFLTNGVCRLLTHTGIDLIIEVPDLGPRVNFYAQLIRLDNSDESSILKYAMDINTRLKDTGGAAIGYKSEFDGLSLCFAYKLKEQNSKQHFIDCLSWFVENAEKISSKLESHKRSIEKSGELTRYMSLPQPALFGQIKSFWQTIVH